MTESIKADLCAISAHSRAQEHPLFRVMSPFSNADCGLLHNSHGWEGAPLESKELNRPFYRGKLTETSNGMDPARIQSHRAKAGSTTRPLAKRTVLRQQYRCGCVTKEVEL